MLSRISLALECKTPNNLCQFLIIRILREPMEKSWEDCCPIFFLGILRCSWGVEAFVRTLLSSILANSCVRTTASPPHVS